MNRYTFLGLLMILAGILVLIRGEASWGAIHIENLSGIKLYLASVPEMLLGIYILYFSIKKEKTDSNKQ